MDFTYQRLSTRSWNALELGGVTNLEEPATREDHPVGLSRTGFAIPTSLSAVVGSRLRSWLAQFRCRLSREHFGRTLGELWYPPKRSGLLVRLRGTAGRLRPAGAVSDVACSW